MQNEIPGLRDSLDAAARTAAAAGLLNIVITVLCIWAAWWALQTFRFDVFFRDPKGARAKLLMILASVLFGHGVARFIIDYLQWSLLLGKLL